MQAVARRADRHDFLPSQSLNLNTAADRHFQFSAMTPKNFLRHLTFIFMVSPLQDGLNSFCKNRTLHPIQLPDPG